MYSPHCVVAPIGAVRLFLACALLCASSGPGYSQKENKAADRVVNVRVDPAGTNGQGQVMYTVNLDIERGWHLYRAPLPADFPGQPLGIRTVAAEALASFPPGKAVHENDCDYAVYEGQVAIPLTITRASGDGPIKIILAYQACNARKCMLPTQVTVTLR